MSEKTRIVATGDSMTDTAGPGMPALAQCLAQRGGDKKFELINQGVGGTRVGYGLWRLTHDYEVLDQHQPSLLSLSPDIVLVESFAYNNASDGINGEGMTHFLDMHRQIKETIETQTGAALVWVATIAPNPDRFVETVPNFAHAPHSIRRWMAEDRIAYLEAFERFAQDSGLPLASAYRASLDAIVNGASVDEFIDPEDCIHPGAAGHQLIAQTITDTLMKHELV